MHTSSLLGEFGAHHYTIELTDMLVPNPCKLYSMGPDLTSHLERGPGGGGGLRGGWVRA